MIDPPESDPAADPSSSLSARPARGETDTTEALAALIVKALFDGPLDSRGRRKWGLWSQDQAAEQITKVLSAHIATLTEATGRLKAEREEAESKGQAEADFWERKVHALESDLPTLRAEVDRLQGALRKSELLTEAQSQDSEVVDHLRLLGFTTLGEAIAGIEALRERAEQAESDLTTLRAQLASSSAWRDIATAPKDGTRVLLCWQDWIAAPHFAVGHNLGSGRRWQDTHDWLHNNGSWPTHWMPLPDPPGSSASPAETRTSE